eukprot:COSAG06_NODE_31792_length_515_cov_1.995192_1_plen_103_part_10
MPGQNTGKIQLQRGTDPPSVRAILDETDILDNAFVMVEFDNGGPRMMLELCMFAEASKNQEEVSVVGDAGKLEAFAPAHQRGGGAHVPNFRRGTRQLPWVDRV